MRRPAVFLTRNARTASCRRRSGCGRAAGCCQTDSFFVGIKAGGAEVFPGAARLSAGRPRSRRTRSNPSCCNSGGTCCRLPDDKQILERVPAKDEFLAEQLRTRSGRKFMRQISRYDNAYDRLDRLSRLPHGEQTVHRSDPRSRRL